MPDATKIAMLQPLCGKTTNVSFIIMIHNQLFLSHYSMASQFYVLFSCLQNSLIMTFLAVIADYSQPPSSHKKKQIIKTLYMSITRSQVGNILPLTNAVPERRCFNALKPLISTRPSDNKKADAIQRKAIESNHLEHRGWGLISRQNTKTEGKKYQREFLGTRLWFKVRCKTRSGHSS